jgi:hypothetical protein
MADLRKGIVTCGFIASALALSGCGSSVSAPSNQDAQDDGSSDSAPDARTVDLPQTGGSDVGTDCAPDSPAIDAADSGATEVAGLDGVSQDVLAVCASPLSFSSSSQPPTMCHGVVLKTYAIPFSPGDSRWSTLYQGCLANYGSLFSSGDCGKLCTALATANPPATFIQGIDLCTLDCSQPGAPVLSVRYFDTICEPLPPPDANSGNEARPEAGLDSGPDARIDGASDARIDSTVDSGTDLTAIDGGSLPRVALRKVYAYGNCMPSIAADPIIVLWSTDVTGATGNTARVTKATITVSKGTSIVQDFTLDNPTISLVGGAGSADQRKSLASISPNQACSSMCSGATYKLDLVFEIDGQTVAVSESGSFACAY